MKIRLGYISNSSSSSFIITDKTKFDEVKKLIENYPQGGYFDYYEHNGKLYTSMVNDGYDLYYDLSKYADEYDKIEGDGEPYDEDGFYKVEGDRGVSSVFIPKEEMPERLNHDTELNQKLFNYCKACIEEYDITNPKVLKSIKKEDMYEWLLCICEIIGFVKEEVEE